jgi:hypothetical protein
VDRARANGSRQPAAQLAGAGADLQHRPPVQQREARETSAVIACSAAP